MKKKLTLQLKTLIIGTFCLMFLSVTHLHAQQLMMRGTMDAVVHEEFPEETAGFFHASNILADRYAESDDEEAPLFWIVSYIKFDISALSNRVIKNAEFSTRGTAQAENAPVIRLRRAGTSFHRDTTNWGNRPGLSGNDLAIKTYDNASARRPYVNIDNRLVDYINDALIRGHSEIGFGIQWLSGDMEAMNWIGGVGDGAWGPELVIEFDEGFAFVGIDDAVAFKHEPENTANDFHVSNIFVNKVDDDTEAVSYVKFHLPGMAYKKVSSVKFSTRGTTQSDTEQTVQLRRTNPNFTRDTTNWENRPGMSGKIATRVYTNSSARTIYTEIGSEMVNFVNSQLAMGNETIAFGLQYDEGDLDAGNWIGGVGDGLWGPMLNVIPDNSNYEAFAIEDAVVFSDEPDDTANDWHPSNLLVAETDERTVISFVQFDISGFSGRVVSDVAFSTRSSMASGTEMTVKLTQAGNAIARDTTNWNNKPNTSGELATVVYNDNSGRKYFVHNDNNLINYINGKLAAGHDVVTFGLEYKEGEGGDLNWIGGKGDGAWGPMLEFTFSDNFNSFATDDAIVFQHEPEETASFFHPTNIYVEQGEETKAVSFVKFDISDVGGRDVVDVAFSTRSSMAAEKVMEVKLAQAGTAFSRDTTNWNNRPSFSGELATVVYDDNSGRKVFIPNGDNLVNYVNAHLLSNATEIAFGLEFKSGDGEDLNWIGGKGDGAWGPQLEFVFRPMLESDTLYVIADAYVSEEEAEENFGDAADMGIRKSGDGTDLETFVKFDISGVADAVVGQVSITAYIAQHNSGTEQDDFFVDIFAVEDNQWEEMEVNWETRPEAGLKLIEENVTWFGAGQDVIWSSDALTHYINAAIAEGREHVSFVLKGKDNTPGDRLWMAGREWKPQATSLILDYLTPPPTQQMPVVADSHVSQVEGEQDQNFGDQADQHLSNDDANNASKWIYFKYDISSAYQETVSATLNAYGSIHDGSYANIDELNFAIYSSADVTWEELEITWENKPAVGTQQLLTGTLLQGGRWMNLTSAAFTNYINTAIDQGKEYVTLVAKALDPTPGDRGWISGREWQGSYITLNYEPEVALPTFSPNPGNYVSSVNVAISTTTANATIYYTLDNTDPDEENGILYDGPITLDAVSENMTYNVRAIAYADELNPSGIASATYHVTPVGLPQFSPTPDVSYQQSVEVTLSVVPAGSIIRYSLDGGAPTTIYDGPILLTEATLIRAQAYNSDFTFATEIVEADYDVVETIPAPGIGPGGVGFSDLSRANQPELSLWLRAHDLEAADGQEINLWHDISGNNNDAHNDGANVGTGIPNAGEQWQNPPLFVANGLNGWPTLHFGTQFGGDNPDRRNMVVDDADNLDGGAGVSLFIVLKRNQMFGDFASIFSKRDLTNQPLHAAYILEMDGGANPNKMQFVIARDIFLKSQDEFNAEDFYLVNTALNSQHQLVTFMTDGVLKSSAAYNKPVQSTHAPVLIGGFQPVDIAEIALFNSDVNNAQTILVKNYLAAKYGLANVEGVFYTDQDHVYDIIGVGRAADITGSASETHNFSSGGGLEIYGASFAADGDFVIAGHNGAILSDDNEAQSWSRMWNVETAGNGANVVMGFDFDEEGITNEPSAEYKLWLHEGGDDWTDMGITPTVDENIVKFAVENIQPGIYTIGVLAPGDIINFVQEEILADEGMMLYPNPARERITLMLNENFTGMVDIRVRDMYGRLISSQSLMKDAASITHEIDLSGLRTGTYMIELNDNRKRSIKLFLVK